MVFVIPIITSRPIMDAPFEVVAGDMDDLSPLGVQVLYHRQYDHHYIRSDGEAEDARWYETSALSTRIISLSNKERAALEEQYQHAKDD